MNELPVSDVNTGVADIVTGGIEAEDIAGLQIILIHMDAFERLIAGNALDSVAKVPVDIVDKS